MVYMTEIFIVKNMAKPYFIYVFVYRKIMQHRNPKEDAEEQNPTKHIIYLPLYPQFVGKSPVFQ